MFVVELVVNDSIVIQCGPEGCLKYRKEAMLVEILGTCYSTGPSTSNTVTKGAEGWREVYEYRRVVCRLRGVRRPIVGVVELGRSVHS